MSAFCFVPSSFMRLCSVFSHRDDELSDEASLVPWYRDFGVLGSGFDIAGNQRRKELKR